MNNIAIYLSSCSTCKKILDSLPKHHLEMRDLKQQPLSESEINALKEIAGSYEALFSRTAQRYKEYGLKEKHLTEKDFKKYLIEHYTFLKRPVFVIGGKIFIGNKKDTVASVIEALS